MNYLSALIQLQRTGYNCHEHQWSLVSDEASDWACRRLKSPGSLRLKPELITYTIDVSHGHDASPQGELGNRKSGLENEVFQKRFLGAWENRKTARRRGL